MFIEFESTHQDCTLYPVQSLPLTINQQHPFSRNFLALLSVLPQYELQPEIGLENSDDNNPADTPKLSMIRRSSAEHPPLTAEEMHASVAAGGVRRHSAAGVVTSGTSERSLTQLASPGPGLGAEPAPLASPSLAARGGRRHSGARRASLRIGVGVDEDEDFAAGREMPRTPGPTLDGEMMYQAEVRHHSVNCGYWHTEAQ